MCKISLKKEKILLASHIIFHLDLAIAQGAPTPTVDNNLDFKLNQTTYHLINELSYFIFRHASVSSTYVSPSVGWLVILLNFHSISVSGCST